MPMLTNPDALHRYIQSKFGLNIPRQSICPHHRAPFDYLISAYFEPSTDLIIWGPRGGGKTRLAAVATVLDLLHKPGISIRILGGSLDQSLRMWEHLIPDLQSIDAKQLGESRSLSRKVTLKNKSTAAVLTQSQRAVRGLRVQKLRCDEVDMFDKSVWSAAQLVTRSCSIGKKKLTHIKGTIEAFSTMHRLDGLMTELIDNARNIPIIRWCLLDVLESCPNERDCATCPLHEECQGRAKQAQGFFSIDDAIAMKRRVSRETWETEMLCLRPKLTGSVFPSFDPDRHVREEVQMIGETWLAIDFGFANPFVCLWVRTDGHLIHVLDEYQQPQRMVHEHIEFIRTKPYGQVTKVACDPAGNGRNDQTAQSNVALLKKEGFNVHSKRMGLIDSIELMRAALKNGMNEARLFIHPRCKQLIRALRAYKYPDIGGELPIKDGVHDHLVDALRYLLINLDRRPAGSRLY